MDQAKKDVLRALKKQKLKKGTPKGTKEGGNDVDEIEAANTTGYLLSLIRSNQELLDVKLKF